MYTKHVLWEKKGNKWIIKRTKYLPCEKSGNCEAPYKPITTNKSCIIKNESENISFSSMTLLRQKFLQNFVAKGYILFEKMFVKSRPINWQSKSNIIQFISNCQCQTKTRTWLTQCLNTRCKLCQLYIQPCKSFLTSNGVEQTIKSHTSKCNVLPKMCFLWVQSNLNLKDNQSSSKVQLQLGEHSNFRPNTEIPIAETENYVSYFVYFSDLKTIYSYFKTIILITMNEQSAFLQKFQYKKHP